MSTVRTSKPAHRSSGFTIVELLIVLVVIGILAAMVIIAFNGLQRRTLITTLRSDLAHAATGMKAEQVISGSYPTIMPANIKASKSVTLSLATPAGTPVYSGLSPVQNGLLFYDTCQQLLAEGVGAKPDDGHHYMSACTVYNKNQIHINGWNGRDVNTPLTTASLDTYVSSYSGGEKPAFTAVATDFMNQLKTRFQAAGGTFPVTSFWDDWATPTNGGVVKPTLPAPTSTSGTVDPHAFCINATHASDPSLKWFVTQSGAPQQGECS